jgi:hypothetical protein
VRSPWLFVWIVFCFVLGKGKVLWFGEIAMTAKSSLFQKLIRILKRYIERWIGNAPEAKPGDRRDDCTPCDGGVFAI